MTKPEVWKREDFYRTLWELCDRRNFITLTQQEISKLTGVSYQRLSEIMDEYRHFGRARKYGRRFQLKDPDSFDWGEEWQRESEQYRKDRGRG